MKLGQHVIAAVLVIAGVARALGEGTGVPVAIGAGAALGVGYALGVPLSAGRFGRLRSRWWLLALTLVWAGALLISSEFIWFGFLLWLLAGRLLPGWWAIAYAVAVYCMAIAAPVLHHGVASWANVFGPLIGGVFAFGIARGYLRLLRDAAERERLLASLSQAQQETADLQDELALTQRHAGRVDERTRLARDIHDTVAQNLSSIRLLAHAKHDGPAESETTRAFEQIEALAGDGITDIRRIIAALTPSDLDDNALAAALARMLDRLGEQTDVRPELHVDKTLPELSTGTEVALMRTAQSALANVRLHSRASRVDVSLIDDHDHVRLDVRDDGIGFDASGWEQASASSDGGYGLLFMRSRLRDLGGGLDIESRPGDGTALSAYLPLQPETQGALT